MPNFFMDVLQDLVYASGGSSGPFRTILKVKRAPKRAYLSFRRLSCAMANHFLGDQNSASKMQKFFVDVRQDLVNESS